MGNTTLKNLIILIVLLAVVIPASVFADGDVRSTFSLDKLKVTLPVYASSSSSFIINVTGSDEATYLIQNTVPDLLTDEEKVAGYRMATPNELNWVTVSNTAIKQIAVKIIIPKGTKSDKIVFWIRIQTDDNSTPVKIGWAVKVYVNVYKNWYEAGKNPTIYIGLNNKVTTIPPVNHLLWSLIISLTMVLATLVVATILIWKKKKMPVVGQALENNKDNQEKENKDIPIEQNIKEEYNQNEKIL